jgi:hypothetical protein
MFLSGRSLENVKRTADAVAAHRRLGGLTELDAFDEAAVDSTSTSSSPPPVGAGPRLDHLALGSILHLPGMLEDVPGDPAGRVARSPAVGYHG